MLDSTYIFRNRIRHTVTQMLWSRSKRLGPNLRSGNGGPGGNESTINPVLAESYMRWPSTSVGFKDEVVSLILKSD